MVYVLIIKNKNGIIIFPNHIVMSVLLNVLFKLKLKGEEWSTHLKGCSVS